MMRRNLAVVVLAAVAVATAFLPAPDPIAEPLAGVVIDSPGIDSPVDSAIWYCAWAQANAARDSFLSVAAVEPAGAEFTFPVAIPGEPPDTAATSTLGPGGSGVILSEIAQRGDSPFFVEFDGGPSAAAVTVTGDVVTTDQCVSQGPDEWFLAGGSTNADESLVLRLFNPFPEVAKVTVTGFSEIGVEALAELRAVSVNPRSWRDIPFEELLRQRQNLVLSVRAEEGLIVPVMMHRVGTDEAWWGGTGLSATWELPIAQAAGTDAAIVVANPSLGEVQVTVDLYGIESSFPGALTFTIPPESPLRIPLGDFEPEVLGARISSSSPVAVAVTGVGAAGTAATAGAPAPSRTWLLPGLRNQGDIIGTLWLLNSSDEPVAVTVGVLTESEVFNSRYTIEPGRLLLVPVTDAGALGFLASAAAPFSAGWTLQGPTGMGFATGVALPDESAEVALPDE